MDLLFTYNQEVIEEHKKSGKCLLEVFEDNDKLLLNTTFIFEFKNHYKIINKFEINTTNGDFYITSEIDSLFKKKKNDFKMLSHFVDVGLVMGERYTSFWGTPYKKAVNKISTIFLNKLKNDFKNKYYLTSLKQKSPICVFYRLIVNYHLDMNNIKSYDGIYNAIKENFPAKKWLKKNDNKYLPAVLESYGIKSNYLIKELNVNSHVNINLKTLKYFCHLFGDNYIDYIKQVDWMSHCIPSIYYSKLHHLKREHEKKNIIVLLNDIQRSNSGLNFLQILYIYFSNLDTIKKIEPNINFKFKDIESFYVAYDKINGILKHRKRGYRIKYTLPEEFLNTIQEPIVINNTIYKPKVLITEEDFILEGHIMKNCMSTHFVHGIIFIYISLKSDEGTINLQYRKGIIQQLRGKANINVPDSFIPAVDVLNERMEKNSEIKWIQEKFDFINLN